MALPLFYIDIGEYWVTKDLPSRSQSASESNLRFGHDRIVLKVLRVLRVEVPLEVGFL